MMPADDAFRRDERLAALRDGTLSEVEREQLLAELAASEDDYEVFTDTAEALDAFEAEDEAKGNGKPNQALQRPHSGPVRRV